MARQLQLLSAILLLFPQETSSEGIPSSCSIPPVEDGGSAILTCKFDMNIYETKDSFQVERYSTAMKKQESLLACQWISDKLECHLHTGVLFDRNITNTFQVVIPLVTSNDFGEYVCYVLPTPNGISKRCYLTERDNNVTTRHKPLSVDTTLMTTPKSIRGPEKSRPLNRGGDNGLHDVYLFEKSEQFAIHFELKGHTPPNISSIQVTGKSKKHHALHENDEWKQIVLPNVPEPFITTIFLRIMTSPMNLFNDYDMNVTNSEGTTTLHFQIQPFETTNKDSDGVAVIIASVSMVAVGILIVLKIGEVVYTRLNQKRDSSKPSRRYSELTPKHFMPGDVDYEEISPQEQDEIHGMGDQVYMEGQITSNSGNAASGQQDYSLYVPSHEQLCNSHCSVPITADNISEMCSEIYNEKPKSPEQPYLNCVDHGVNSE